MSWLSMAAVVGLLGLGALTAAYYVLRDILPAGFRNAFERLGASPLPYVVALVCFAASALVFMVSGHWLGAASALLSCAWSVHLFRLRPKASLTSIETGFRK
ncbi:MAG: hypothetical protein ACK56C_05565 [Alphaproteobacteria bacterium]